MLFNSTLSLSRAGYRSGCEVLQQRPDQRVMRTAQPAKSRAPRLQSAVGSLLIRSTEFFFERLYEFN